MTGGKWSVHQPSPLQEPKHVRYSNDGYEEESNAVHRRSIERTASEGRGTEASRAGGREQARLHYRREGSDQPRFEQLFGIDDPQGVEEGGAGCCEAIWSRSRGGAHDRRDNEDSHGAGGADCALQECGSVRGVSVGVYGECGNGIRGAREGRPDRFRRIESCFDY